MQHTGWQMIKRTHHGHLKALRHFEIYCTVSISTQLYITKANRSNESQRLMRHKNRDKASLKKPVDNKIVPPHEQKNPSKWTSGFPSPTPNQSNLKFRNMNIQTEFNINELGFLLDY